jgi:hypothetical protein
VAGDSLSKLMRLHRRRQEPAQSASEDAARAATDWQQLYWSEVQLRQTEAARAQQTIAQLQAQLQHLQDASPARLPSANASQLKQEVGQYQTVLELKSKLLEVLKERCGLQIQIQELHQALAAEQEAHAQTRQSLTTSLGDVMEALVQIRDRQPQGLETDDQEDN